MDSNKTALISGGARGIGRCLARRFLERGYRVYILDIDEAEPTHTTQTHLKSYYDDHKVASAVCNLCSVAEIRDCVKTAAHFLGGRIEVLVNNGGIATPTWSDGKTMADKNTIQEWQAYMETNLTAPFAMSQACLPFMKKHDASEAQHKDESCAGPCIVHVGSFRATRSDPNQEGYAASKAGLRGLAHSMAISLQPWGVRVNLVAPGRVKVAHESRDGDGSGQTWARQNQQKDVDNHAANRAGRPSDIADAVEYLVNAGFVTGQEITVDGGVSIKKT